jgi:hypothetical protein
MTEGSGVPEKPATRQGAGELIPTEGASPSDETELATQPMATAERRLASEDIVVSAPVSFHGSAARIWRLTRLTPDKPWATVALGTGAIILIAFAWTFVLAWYVIFGLLLVPYRLIRRGQRKRKLDEARHREMLSAMDDRR